MGLVERLLRGWDAELFICSASTDTGERFGGDAQVEGDVGLGDAVEPSWLGGKEGAVALFRREAEEFEFAFLLFDG